MSGESVLLRAGTAPSADSPTDGARRRPWMTVLVVLAVLAAVLASVARGLYRDGPLEPDAPTAGGSKAVVQVLGDLGVEVTVDRHTSAAADALRGGGTVLVTEPNALSGEQLALLGEARSDGGGRLVLVAPDGGALSWLDTAIYPVGMHGDEALLEPGAGCGDLAGGARMLEIPQENDSLRGPAYLYRTVEGTGARTCFPVDNWALVAEDDGLVVLGSADLLTNAGVGRADNSALVLNTLGAEGTLSWYVPSPNDPMAATEGTLLAHIPSWAGPLLLWVLLAAVLALLALSHRLGPVVVEPMPVTVRAQELVLGRARLLQRAGAPDAAARSLRAATATRLADRLGLRRTSTLDHLLAAVGPHTDLSPEQLRTLLGPTPVTGDDALVRLARDLDRLEKEIDR